MLAIQMVIILYFAEPTCILQKKTKTLTRGWTMSINIPGLILCKQMQIITEHESLHQKKQFDWTLRGHDP